MRLPRVLSLLSVSVVLSFNALAQQQVASLHPNNGLVWQRVSPTAQKPEGPVLYQLLFNASGTPGTLSAFDTNPRHLTNSLITQDAAGIHIGALAIAPSGAITLCCGQSFGSGGAGGTVTAITAGLGLLGAPLQTITTSGTIGLNTGYTDARYLRLIGGTMQGPINFVAGQTFPGAGTGTVTSVSGTAPVNVASATTTPIISLAAGGITNALLANPNLTINTGSGLGGGGAVTLGGSLNLSNAGLLGLSASAPLAATAGQNPVLTLGTVGIANGGTGITTAPASAGQYLRSSAVGTWSVNGIQSTDLPTLSGTYVDLSTNQTIGGNKTFSNIISGNISGNAATATTATTATSATTATTANNALALGGNAASAYNTMAQNNLLYLQLTGGTLTGGLSGTTGNFGGLITLNGGAHLPATGAATASTGFNSSFTDWIASVFNSSAGAALDQRFRWQAEPVNNDTANANGTLNLLFASGANTLAETGLSIANNGKITFAPGQTFPGAGGVTSITAGAGLNGGTITTSGTIAVAPGGVTNSMLTNPSLTVTAGAGLGGGGTVALGAATTLNASIFHDISLTGNGGSSALGVAAGGVTNAMLTNPSLTVTAGAGLGGGGTVALGAATTLNANIFHDISLTGNGGSSALGVAAGGITNTMLAANAVNASDIASGQVVKSLNGQADAVTLAGTNGLSTSASSGTVTVTSNATPSNTASTIVSRDASGNFSAGTVTLNGALALPNTTSASVGVITLGGVPFLHNFGTANTFVGASAGNMSTTGTSNSAFGASTLQANTTGSNNAAFGSAALKANTINSGNSAFGYQALLNNNDSNTSTNASNNSAFGFNALLVNVAGTGNSAFGASALSDNTVGNNNAAFGASALFNNTASGNSAFGSGAMQSDTLGDTNSAFGFNALQANTTGTKNSAFGTSALIAEQVGSGNSAFGASALAANLNGTNNIAIGQGALTNLVTGSNNIAIGQLAGNNLTGGENNNIYIGNFLPPMGAVGEINTIRIGNINQKATFIAGILNVPASGNPVEITPSGQLGTIVSSRRYKHKITSLGEESEVLMKLHPVSFYYKPQYDPEQARQYGLIAEEVAQVAPQLVILDKDGLPQAVRYQFVNAMLLNEVQKQRRLLEEQQRVNAAQQSQNAAQQKQLEIVQSQMAAMRQQVLAQQEQMEALMLRLASMEKSLPRGSQEQVLTATK